MSWLNERNVKFEKRRSYVKTTITLNFERKNAPYVLSVFKGHFEIEDRNEKLSFGICIIQQ